MEAILKVYKSCESDEVVKEFTCKRVTYNASMKIDAINRKVTKLQKSITKDMTEEEIDAITDEIDDLNVETVKALFPEFTKDDFKGVDILEYKKFCNEVGKYIAEVIKATEKN